MPKTNIKNIIFLIFNALVGTSMSLQIISRLQQFGKEDISNRIQINGLFRGTTEDELKEAFKKYGEITDAVIMKNVYSK